MAAPVLVGAGDASTRREAPYWSAIHRFQSSARLGRYWEGPKGTGNPSLQARMPPRRTASLRTGPCTRSSPPCERHARRRVAAPHLARNRRLQGGTPGRRGRPHFASAVDRQSAGSRKPGSMDRIFLASASVVGLLLVLVALRSEPVRLQRRRRIDLDDVRIPDFVGAPSQRQGAGRCLSAAAPGPSEPHAPCGRCGLRRRRAAVCRSCPRTIMSVVRRNRACASSDSGVPAECLPRASANGAGQPSGASSARSVSEDPESSTQSASFPQGFGMPASTSRTATPSSISASATPTSRGFTAQSMPISCIRRLSGG